MFQSPLGFLLFQTNNAVLNRFGRLFQSPLGFLLFQTTDGGCRYNPGDPFQSPLGFLFFQTATAMVSLILLCFNPLWGFCSSKRAWKADEESDICFNPLWGFCSSKQANGKSTAMDVKKFQSPLGFLFFQTDCDVPSGKLFKFQSPLGFLFFQTLQNFYHCSFRISSNPLWGFCSSKLDLREGGIV